MKHTNFLRTSFSKALFLVRVEGESLWPYLVPGGRYIASGLLRPRAGDFAVFRSPAEPSRVLVKKVREVSDQGYVMASTVSWGSSSDDFGVVPYGLIMGKIIYHRGAGN